MQNLQAKPPKAIRKPHTSHIQANYLGGGCDPHATYMRPPSHPHATPKPGKREGNPCASVVLLWGRRSHRVGPTESVLGFDSVGWAEIQMNEPEYLGFTCR